MKALITTALHSDLKNKNQTYLGKWCLSEFNLDSINKNANRILDYHWDNKIKFINDSKIILKIFHSTLPKLSKSLDEFHKINTGNNYWKILLGDWLLNFITVLYDRWELISLLPRNEYKFFTHNVEFYVPRDSSDSFDNYGLDIWNKFIFDKIIQFQKFENIELSTTLLNNYNKNDDITSHRRITFTNLKKNSNLFIFQSNLGLLNEFLMSFRFNNIPRISLLPNKNLLNFGRIKIKERKIKLKIEPNDKFEIFLSDMINMLIPSSFVEDFKIINEHVAKYMPGYSKNVVTSNAQINHKLFTFWLAKNRDKIDNLTILQNGGNVGSALIQAQEYHDIAIADKYISWGWGNNKKNIKSLGSSKIIKIKKKYKNYSDVNKSEILFVITNGPKYNYTLISQAHGPQFIDELNKIIQIYKLIQPKLKKYLSLRLNPKDFGWHMKKKIKASLPQLTLDSEKDFYKSIINKKLLIFNYNGTSFLEALSLKIPTLLLFDKNIWHIKNNEIQYFNLLKNVGILHDNPNDITKFINNNLNDLDKWWNGLELQSNVNLFCKNYINYDNNLENKII